MRLFQLLKDIITAIRNISNKYYTTSGTATGTYRTSFTVCSLENLPKGVYLVLGKVNGNVDVTASTLNASISGNIIVGAQGRGFLNAGGGVHTWGLISVEGADTNYVRLTTYRYYSGSVTYEGVLAAIRLI